MRTLWTRHILPLAAAAGVAAALVAAPAHAEPNRPECIAPAQPGGGFDLTCRLAQGALRDSNCLLYTSPSPRDVEEYRMPSSA